MPVVPSQDTVTAFGVPKRQHQEPNTIKKGTAMDTPRLSGYPIDRTIIQRSQRGRQARRARKKATQPPRRWLVWLLG